jgi:excisionase family DNA binding protein
MANKISMSAAGDYLGVDKRTVQRLIATGKLPAYRVGNKLVRIDIDDLEKMLKPVLPGGDMA